MKPETQIRALVKHIQPLADCLASYRPTARNIHIHRSDWDTLIDNPTVAITHGFAVQERTITFKGFTLMPIDSLRRHHGGGRP